jgi:lipoprotein-anchoring transpeptidase ErfK/SrfK
MKNKCLSLFSVAMLALVLGACSTKAPIKPPVVSTPETVQQVWSLESKTHLNPKNANQPWIIVGIKSQTLRYFDEQGNEQSRYIISSAKNGLGEQNGSYQTPRGWHKICQKIGANAPIDSIFYRRELTGSVYSEALHQQRPNSDWILTRILWLCGQEPGLNQGGSVDSYDRKIYIHGAGAHTPWGLPSSLGCIRMKSPDVIDLFNRVGYGVDVLIDENS